MSDIRFTYICLKLLLLIIFFVFGYLLSKAKTNREYWNRAWVPILAYAIVHGLRFGRDIDWNIYYFKYINLGENINLEDYELMFGGICNIMYNLGFSYPIFIFFQCAFFMFAIMVLVNNFRKYAFLILPIVLTTIVQNDNFIRWYVAVSFFLLSINSLIKENNKTMYIWFVCAFLNHSGIIVLAPILFFYKQFNTIKIDYKVGAGLMFATCFVLSLSHLSFLVSIANSLISMGLGDLGGVSGYLWKVEVLLNGEFGRTGIMERSLSNNIRVFVSAAPVIWLGGKYMQQYHYGALMYNLFVIGAIVTPLFMLIEIFNRYATVLFFFFSIVGGITYYEILKQYISNRSRVVYMICLFGFLSTVWPHVSDAISRNEDNKMIFVWDANGREFLPYWQNANDLIVDPNK